MHFRKGTSTLHTHTHTIFSVSPLISKGNAREVAANKCIFHDFSVLKASFVFLTFYALRK